eukprot:96171-Prorocentrum_minimum.AAC.1
MLVHEQLAHLEVLRAVRTEGDATLVLTILILSSHRSLAEAARVALAALAHHLVFQVPAYPPPRADRLLPSRLVVRPLSPQLREPQQVVVGQARRQIGHFAALRRQSGGC